MCLAALILPVTPQFTPGGDACLPKDVVSLIRGDAVERVATQCHGRQSCTPECLNAVNALKTQHCFPHLTQPQSRGSRIGGPTLSAMQGIFYGLYPASGVELLELSYDASTSTLTGTKLTGNQFVRAGRLSWEATPSGCRVVSSMWSGVYKPRWDPCSLTMWEDHLTIDLGGNDDDHLTFVRAEAALLLGWDERRSPMNGFADVFERCDVSIEAGWDAVASGLWELLHRSEHTVRVHAHAYAHGACTCTCTCTRCVYTHMHMPMSLYIGHAPDRSPRPLRYRRLLPTPYALRPTPYSLLATRYSLLTIDYLLLPTPYSLLPAPYLLLAASYSRPGRWCSTSS